VASYADARAAGGRWLLRIEDVDRARCHARHADAIVRLLATYGFAWDGEVTVQSKRGARYTAVLESLVQRGLAYACRCTRREVAQAGLAGIEGPLYPGTCRAAQLPRAGHALRLAVSPGEVAWHDRCQGALRQDVHAAVGDFALAGRDGGATYQLAVVVDDHDTGVTHVVRGADLIESTARQILLHRALGWAAPTYLHVPVVANEFGQKLSKQTHARPLELDRPLPALLAAARWLGQNVPGPPTDVPAYWRQLIGGWDARRIAPERQRRAIL
jgi:glutamyl-Q tRNA(Asp) synthetase